VSGARRRPVVGRVLAVASTTATIQESGGQITTVSVELEAVLGPGDLVSIGADGSLQTVFTHPRGDWPAPGTDAMRFLDGSLWARLRRRSEILGRTRSFFVNSGFLEVETPLVVDSAGTEVHIDPTRVIQRQRAGTDPVERFLIPSPEHHMKRLLAAGAPPIFSLGPVWRDGEAGARHRPEFTLLEWYRPWGKLEHLFDDCESWLRALHPEPYLDYQGHQLRWDSPWPRHGFLDLLRQRGDVHEPERLTPDEQLVAFVEHVEATLGRDTPEFVIDYPVAFASLAQRQSDRPELAERFELYAAGLELANAFGELTDASEQRARCEQDNRDRRDALREELPLDETFLSALKEGLPPSAGIAVGMDRVVMLLTNAATIDEVRAF
jgi:lysyl-tRNA synthetase class 2